MITASQGVGVRPAIAVRMAVTDRVAVGALSVLVLVLVALTWQTWGNIGVDTGYDFVAGSRVADGEIPYRDFTYFYGPLAPAVAGLSALLGGDGIATFVGLGLAIAIAIVFATYAVARLAAGPAASAAAAGITAGVAFAPTNFSFVLPHTYSATLGILALLVLVLAIGRFARSGRTSWLAGAGVAAAAVALARPEFVPAVLLGAGVWMVLRMLSGTGRRRELIVLLAPAVGIPLVVYGIAMALTSPGELLLDNLYPVDQIEAGAGAVAKITAPLTAASFAELAGRMLVYAGLAGALVLAGILLERSAQWRRAVLAAACGAGALMLLVLVVRPELIRHGFKYVFGWMALGAAVAVGVLLWRYRRRGAEGWTPVAQVKLALALVLVALAAPSYAGFFAHATVPQSASYAIPVAAVLLAWLHTCEIARSADTRRIAIAWLALLALGSATLAVHDARDQGEQVSGPGGSIAAERTGDAAVYQTAVDEILRRTGPGDPILVAPQLTSLYALTGRDNPLPQISLLPGSLPDPASELEAIRRLDAAGVALVLTDRRELSAYGEGAFGTAYNNTLGDWLSRDFTRVATIDNDGAPPALDIWQRT